MSSDDTIAAISTPIGKGGIGIIRLSGPEAVRIAAELIPPTHPPVIERPSHMVFYTKLVDPDTKETLDECLVNIMRAPRTYTREDVVEINVHSGVPTLKMILRLLLGLGARVAEPGEFTRRAFLSGRIDLTQAEAIASLIRAHSETAARAAARQAEGYLSEQIALSREWLLEAVAQLEAAVDFSDEHIDPKSFDNIIVGVTRQVEELDILIGLAERGRIYGDGLRTAIIGRPNVGKSSLLNALSLDERAIVSAQPGTTRDIVESTVLLGEVPLLLRDTAGWRVPTNDIEAQGIARMRGALDNADLVLLVLDSSEPLTAEDSELIELIQYDKPLVTIINKCDLKGLLNAAVLPGQLKERPVVWVCATNRDGFDQLEVEVATAVGLHPELGAEDMILADARQRGELCRAREGLAEAIQAAGNGFGEEVMAPLLKDAVRCLSSVAGEDIDEEILDKIFSRFCIGK